ncbi:MAG: hypothetical protein IKP66_02185 [Lachnospiraceae bacterium]|nr:hypothetical protein [Lachnospiraceae bacterium]
MIPLKEIIQLSGLQQHRDLDETSAQELEKGFTTSTEDLGVNKIRVTWF